MKLAQEKDLVPNKELFNFILTGNIDSVDSFGPGSLDNLSGATVVVESRFSRKRWAKLAGILE